MPALSKLHGPVEAGACTSWLQWYSFLLGSQLDCTAAEAMSQQSKLFPSRACVCMCTPVLQWCGCWSHCSALSVHLCALCHTGLSHAAAADQMLPLLAQVLAIPTSCRHSFYLPLQPRTGGGAEFSLGFFSFLGWNSSVREPNSATLK